MQEFWKNARTNYIFIPKNKTNGLMSNNVECSIMYLMVFGSIARGVGLERNYIKEYRLQQGIKTKRALAKLAGVPESTLREIENHKMRGNPATLNKIARALGISREELYVMPR